MTQEQRGRVMKRFRSGGIDLLIATDVAARGLDIEQLSHVVNYDVPSDPDAYVHRIGRVGRAGREGVAITLAEPREHRMLKTIERATGQTIGIERVPTVADLRARRLDLTRGALRETLLEGDLDRFRAVIEPLADEFDVVEIALAATKLAHEATNVTEEDDTEIPAIAARPDRPRRERVAKLFVGAGRNRKLRPTDLVGAITGETRLNGRDIGAIEITERFSLVELPESAIDEVIAALRRGTIKGKKPTIRRDKGR
jgi:ATP-dependent RNA helicase DeaD